MVRYLQKELRDMHKEYEIIQKKWDTANIKERIIMASIKEKIEENYFHFYMICHNMGIIPEDLK